MTEITHPHDKFFKAAWTQPGVAQAFLQEYLPTEITAGFGLKRSATREGQFYRRVTSRAFCRFTL